MPSDRRAVAAERRADDARAERHRRSLGVQSARELHVGSGTVGIMLQVILARPGELHRRRRHRLGDLHRFGDVIRAAAASESAAQILRVDQALVGRQTRDHRGGLLRQGLNLRRHPDVAAVRTHLHGRVQRLHGSVRKIRRFVHCFDFLGGAGEGALGIACLAHRHAGLRGQTGPFLPQSREWTRWPTCPRPT